MELLDWIKNRKKWSVFKKNTIRAIIAACIYQIWRNRNEALWMQKVWTIEYIVHVVKKDISNRISFVLPKKMTKRDRSWFERLCKQV